MLIRRRNVVQFIAALLVAITVIGMTLVIAPANVVRADTQAGTVINVNSWVNMRSRASTKSSVVKQVPLGTALTIEKSVNAESDDTSGYRTWYKVSCTVSGTKYSGYIASHFVKINPTPTPTPTPTTTPNPTTVPTVAPPPAPVTPGTTFEQQLAQFPASYQPFLKELHNRHPKWNFVAQTCTKSWDQVLDLETRNGISLVQDTVDDSWKSKAAGHYDPTTKTYTVIDSPNWVNASRAIVAYYMDPRNSLNESSIFQFLNLDYSMSAIPDKPDYYVGKVLEGTFMQKQNASYAGTSMGYGQVIAIGGYDSNVNPIFLAARIVQEVGVNGSKSSNGATGYYNFYNIGAYSDATDSAYVGLRFAQFGNGVPGSDFNKRYLIPWTTQGASIVGGARWISDNYITKGQNTIYYMRFNVSPKATNAVGYHQYMTATTSPSGEAGRMYNAYVKSGLQDTALTFIIPVYTGMPSEKTPLPTTSNAANDYAIHIYTSLLGRNPTANELPSVSSALSKGGDALKYVANVIATNEFKSVNSTYTSQVTAVYKVLLGRLPDKTGLDYYTGLMNQGYSIFYVFTNIANAAEAQSFIKKYSLYAGTYTDTDLVDNSMSYKPFVTNLYSGMLNRTCGGNEYRSWIYKAASKSKSGQEIAYSFFSSPEFKNANLTDAEYVRRLYRGLYGRVPGEFEVGIWVDEMVNNHRSLEYVFTNLVNSDEFNSICAQYGITTTVYTCKNAYHFNYNSAKGREFITRLYSIVLHRTPDETGMTYWDKKLASGMTGRDVGYGFVFSNELIARNLSNEQFIEMLYLTFLNRTPDGTGNAHWLRELESGKTRVEVFDKFVLSAEYEARCLDAGIIPNANYAG